MTRCDYCGATILFGGTRRGTRHFCNDRCDRAGMLLAASQEVPAEVVRQSVREVHAGLCPRCGGTGPVDVHVRHRVWSAVLLTSWVSRPQVSCRSCGTKGQVADAIFSLVLGWWGVPWGLVMTPVQVVRNAVGIVRGPDPATPSPALEKIVRLGIASRAQGPAEGRAA